MMRIDVVQLPSQLSPATLDGRAVVVLDVLRATTSMVAAIASGATAIRVFDSLATAQSGYESFEGSKLLCGERDCVRPDRFDLGNSPAEFESPNVAGKALFMSTTNGTRAIVAARNAPHRFAAALVNATSMARHLAGLDRDVTLLCAGTNGVPAPEDQLGAGAILYELPPAAIELSDSAEAALDLYRQARGDIGAFLRDTDGGRNIIAAGLDADIDFAARLNAFDCVVEFVGEPPVARPARGTRQ